MLVRWGLEALPEVLAEMSITRPALISTERWRELELPVARRFHGARPHAELAGVRGALEAVEDSDGLVALGGGSALDTAKAVSARTELPLVSIPTTYSGAEWTQLFGIRDAQARIKGGGMGARTEAIVYDTSLTLGLPARESAGTAMNALAHCAEGLYGRRRSEESDDHALAGARLISRWLPAVAKDGADREARQGLLEGAMHAGAALRAGMGLGHALAQALGGRYGLPHGTMNAVCLPLALDYNRDAAAAQIARFGEALGHADPLGRTRELATLAGPPRLRDYDVPREDLTELAEVIAERPPAQSNPRPAPAEAIRELLEAAW
jgi:alcohol dehydrogenase class IV